MHAIHDFGGHRAVSRELATGNVYHAGIVDGDAMLARDRRGVGSTAGQRPDAGPRADDVVKSETCVWEVGVGGTQQIVDVAGGGVYVFRGLIGPGVGRTDDGLRASRQAKHHPAIDFGNDRDCITVADTAPRHGDVNALAAVPTAGAPASAWPGLPDTDRADDAARANLLGLSRELSGHDGSNSFAGVANDLCNPCVARHERAVIIGRQGVGDSEPRVVGASIVVNGATPQSRGAQRRLTRESCSGIERRVFARLAEGHQLIE